MPRWGMVIDLDKCVACQSCSVTCRMENNTPVVAPQEAALGRSMLWNEVFPLAEGLEPPPTEAKTHFFPRPCMHCDNPPCVKVCPVGATYKSEETGGQVLQRYDRCIGCRMCVAACPYGARYFNWYPPQWSPENAMHLNPDAETRPRPRGVVEKCTYCVHRLRKAQEKAAAEGRDFRPDEYQPACVQTCIGRARYFGDLDDPNSTVYKLAHSRRAFRLQEELGTQPRTIYLKEG